MGNKESPPPAPHNRGKRDKQGVKIRRVKKMEKRYMYRYDWGNGKNSEWKELSGFEYLRREAHVLFDRPDAHVVEELIGRLERLTVNGQTRQYHGSSYNMLDGVKQPCSEYLEFKRFA